MLHKRAFFKKSYKFWYTFGIDLVGTKFIIKKLIIFKEMVNLYKV